MNKKASERTWRRVMLRVAMIGAAATIIAAFIGVILGNTPPPPPKTSAVILSPYDKDTVDRVFRVDGKTDSLSRDSHLWLAVEIGKLIWIKEPELRGNDKTWSVEIVEGGSPPEGKLALLLIKVGAQGQDFIVKWIADCKRTGDWSGIKMDDIPTASILDRVNDLKLK
jgi:hypothetical protein